MRVIESDLPGVLIIEPRVFKDDRGYFVETYHSERYLQQQVRSPFVQDNLSYSKQGVLRGLHYQLGRPQGKLVMAVSGEIYDVAVDIRRGSPTFGRWMSALLSSENCRQIYIPQGFAHGFCVTSTTAVVLYKCTDFYAPNEERGLRWNDPALAIEWPVQTPVLSGKDEEYPSLEDMPDDQLPLYGRNA